MQGTHKNNYLADFNSIELTKQWSEKQLDCGYLFVDKITQIYPYIQAITGIKERLGGVGSTFISESNGLYIASQVVMWLREFPYIRPYNEIHVQRGKKAGLYANGSCACLGCIYENNSRMHALLASVDIKHLTELLKSKHQYFGALRNFLRQFSNHSGDKEVKYGRYKLDVFTKLPTTGVLKDGNVVTTNTLEAGFTIHNVVDQFLNVTGRVEAPPFNITFGYDEER